MRFRLFLRLALVFCWLGCADSRDSRQQTHALETKPVAAPATSQARGPEATSPFVRVIGSVQDGGFPHAACSGVACRRARDSEVRRYVTSLALVLPGSGKVYLFDASPDIREQLEAIADVRGVTGASGASGASGGGIDRAPIDGVFLSHAHIGHYLGLAFFGYEAVHTRDLPVYSTPRMASFLRGNGPWSQLVDKENVYIEEIPSGAKVELEDGVSVTFVPSPHREEYTDTVGFLIRGPERALLFVPDTDAWRRWSPSIEDWLGEVDVALLDGTFYSQAELPNRSIEEIGHPLVASSMDRFEELEAQPEVVFIHMNHSNPVLLDDSPERAALERRGFKVAAEGMEFGL